MSECYNHLRNSNLNFLVTETPYSAQIILRKRFSKSSQGPEASSNLLSNESFSELENEIKNHKQEIVMLEEALHKREENVKISKESCSILEQKIGKVEAEALKTFEQNNSEVKTLKTVNRSMNNELAYLKRDLNSANKIVKQKKKEIMKLDHKCENLTTKVRKYKEDLNCYKVEKSRAEKELKKRKIKLAQAACVRHACLRAPCLAWPLFSPTFALSFSLSLSPSSAFDPLLGISHV